MRNLATRTRNTMGVEGGNDTFELLAMPTITQQRAMELIAEHQGPLKSTSAQPVTSKEKNAGNRVMARILAFSLT